MRNIARALTILLVMGGMTAGFAAAQSVQLARITTFDGVPGDDFGFATALNAGVLAVAAPFADVGGNAAQGAVYVFLRPIGGWTSTSTYTAKLTASDGVPGDNFGGGALAISDDGNTIVVGACSQVVICRTGNGKAYVFVKPRSGWANMTQTAELSASDAASADGFGQSVGIAGQTVAIGAPVATIDGKLNQGAVYLYVEPVSGWANMSETAKLTASDGQAQDVFGEVSVAAGGSLVFVGAPNARATQPQAGAAYIFVRPAEGWQTTSRFQAKLTASDGAPGDGFGVCQSGSVCISGDGNTVLVGAPQFNGLRAFGAGKAYIFLKPANGWATTSAAAAELTASDGKSGDAFGWAVAISSNAAIIGAVRAKAFQGQGYFFAKPATGWKSTAKSTAEWSATDGGPNDAFGYSVALSGNASVLGARGDHWTQQSGYGPGAAYIFGPQRKASPGSR